MTTCEAGTFEPFLARETGDYISEQPICGRFSADPAMLDARETVTAALVELFQDWIETQSGDPPP